MKFRTDFVTNSSSSSFVLVVRITLKNGKVLKYSEEGDPECGIYPSIVANASPEELGQSGSVEELISALKASIVQEGNDEGRAILDDNDTIIKQLRKVRSMDEIDKITINGDLYGRGGEQQYRHYTYYRDIEMQVYDEGGVEPVNEEGSGGRIAFFDTGTQAPHFGEAVIQTEDGEYKAGDDYTRKRGMNPIYDRDVYVDPALVTQIMQEISEQRAAYSEAREHYLALFETFPFCRDEIRFAGKLFCFNCPSSDSVEKDISALGGLWRANRPHVDYLIFGDNWPSAENIPSKHLKYEIDSIRNDEKLLRNALATGNTHGMQYLSLKELQKVIAKAKKNFSATVERDLAEWKTEFPFDHVEDIEFAGKTFAYIGSTAEWFLEALHINHPVPCRRGNERVSKDGGRVLWSPAEYCDYAICGLNAKGTSALEKALTIRDVKNAPLKIIPEDEFLRILAGEKLPLSPEAMQAIEDRKAALKKAWLEELALTEWEAEEKKRQLEEEKAQKKEAAAQKVREREALRQQKAQEKEELRRQKEQERLDKEEAAKRRKETEEAARQERIRREAEERAEKIKNDVLYRPGEEPANIRRRLDTLFAKLDGAYPDRQISRLNAEHSKWGETVTELYRLLGYPDGRALLEAYGYTVISAANGRPAANNYTEAIEELKRRYPNGSGFKTLAELKDANGDLPFKSMSNTAQSLFGMTLVKYLKQLGILS